MATNFPTSLDSFTNITTPTSTTLETEVGWRTHSEFHNDYNDAIEALETKVWVDGSAVTTSLTYKIASIESQIPTLDAQNVKLTWTQTISGNKTFSGTVTFSGAVVGMPWITWEIRMWTTSTAPTNWLICDWSAISRTTYSNLFSVIGTTYGAWNWSTTFNIPNLKGKVVVGLNSSETEFDTLWETWGEKTHLLTSAESGVPAHTHHISGLSSWSGGPDTWGYQGWSGGSNTDSNTAANASQAHNNLQPYITLNYIISI